MNRLGKALSLRCRVVIALFKHGSAHQLGKIYNNNYFRNSYFVIKMW